jgi:RHS repeat-associated protein
LGNVRTVISDAKLIEDIGSTANLIDNDDNFIPEVRSFNDYYPFGSPMPGRNFNGNGYRYGFNGKELDNEIKGNGNSLDFGARIYDPRLGRFLSVDPLYKEYPNISPYAYVANSPIIFVDHDGRHIRDANGNIVYTKQNAAPSIGSYKAGKTDLQIIYTPVWIYANDGSKHEAFLTTVKTMDGKDVTELSNRLTYDCHGLTQTEGKLFIDSGDPIEGLLKGDRNGKLEESSAIEQAKKGDILIFRDKNGDISHTAICNDDELCSYNSKNGWQAKEEKTESLDNLKKYYGDKITTTPSVENRTLNGLGKEGKNGLAEYSEKEVKEAIKKEDTNEKK